MTIAVPAPTMIATNDLTTTEIEATPPARIAMTEVGVPGGGGAVAGVKGSRTPDSGPTVRAPFPLGIRHPPAPLNRAATVAAARAVHPIAAASLTGASPRPVVPPIAAPLPLAATDAPPNNPHPSPSPKVDADAVTVAASAVRPVIGSLGICKTPPCRPEKSSASWSR